MGTAGVDGARTTSNHVAEVFETLGIEAARRKIILEIKKILESYGIGVDSRHLMLLAEVMTFKGEVRKAKATSPSSVRHHHFFAALPPDHFVFLHVFSPRFSGTWDHALRDCQNARVRADACFF
jgi:hypothetical protein